MSLSAHQAHALKLLRQPDRRGDPKSAELSARELGIVVAIATQHATVHYVDCPYYGRAINTHLPLPAKTRVRLCSWCRPTEDDIRAAPPEVSWYPWSHSLEHREEIPMEMAEDIVARQSMGNGRTPRRRAS